VRDARRGAELLESGVGCAEQLGTLLAQASRDQLAGLIDAGDGTQHLVHDLHPAEHAVAAGAPRRTRARAPRRPAAPADAPALRVDSEASLDVRGETRPAGGEERRERHVASRAIDREVRVLRVVEFDAAPALDRAPEGLRALAVDGQRAIRHAEDTAG